MLAPTCRHVVHVKPSAVVHTVTHGCWLFQPRLLLSFWTGVCVSVEEFLFSVSLLLNWPSSPKHQPWRGCGGFTAAVSRSLAGRVTEQTRMFQKAEISGRGKCYCLLAHGSSRTSVVHIYSG